MPEKGITREEIEQLPLITFEGRLLIIDRREDCDSIVPRLLKQPILGFDTETRPSFRKGRKNRVSLLQLATENTVYLFRLNRIGLPANLTALLSDPRIIKVGAAVREDLRRLNELRKFEPAGFIDLQTLAKQNNIPDLSLRKMAAVVLKKRISKAQQLSNWDNTHLTEPQKRYAATDAWICALIYKKLLSQQHER